MRVEGEAGQEVRSAERGGVYCEDVLQVALVRAILRELKGNGSLECGWEHFEAVA